VRCAATNWSVTSLYNRLPDPGRYQLDGLANTSACLQPGSSSWTPILWFDYGDQH